MLASMNYDGGTLSHHPVVMDDHDFVLKLAHGDLDFLEKKPSSYWGYLPGFLSEISRLNRLK